MTPYMPSVALVAVVAALWTVSLIAIFAGVPSLIRLGINERPNDRLRVVGFGGGCALLALSIWLIIASA